MGEGDTPFELDARLERTDGFFADGRIRVDGDGIHANGIFVPRTECIGSASEPLSYGSGHHVRILQRTGTVGRLCVWHVRTSTEREAAALLHALGIASDQRALHVASTRNDRIIAASVSAAFVLFVILGALFAFLSKGSAPVALIVAALLVVAMAAVFAWQRNRLVGVEVCVGVDGVAVRHGIDRHYWRFEEIRAIDPLVTSFRLRIDEDDEGECTYELPHHAYRADILDLLHARIAQGMRERRESRFESRERLVLPERAEDPKSWMALLREWGSGKPATSYRVADVSAPSLDGALFDASLEAEERIGVAIALRHRDGKAARLRLASDVTASPTTKRILTRVADDASDDEIAALLRRRIR